MKGNLRRVVFGTVLILLGAVFLLNNMGLIDVELRGVWPIGIMLVGLIFMVVGFWDSGQYRQLFTGSILLGYGLIFWGVYTTGWWDIYRVWPLFLLVPGLGFTMMYFWGQKRRDYLRKGVFMSLLAGAVFVIRDRPDLFWPLILIGVGVIAILQGNPPRKRFDTARDDVHEPPDR